jgi:pimeloyl-ACP methyl ester carboxylesterase
MKTQLGRLDLRAVNGSLLPHRFFRHDETPRGLLFVLPGHAYSGDAPLLYYPALALREQGWDTLAISYSYQSRMADASGEAVAEALQESRQALVAALSTRPYPAVALLGKSLGTAVAAYLVSDVPDLLDAPVAYLTPLIGSPLFDTPFATTRGPAYLALGTADPYCDLQALERLRAARPFTLTKVEDADHGMNVAGDLDGSIRAVRRIALEAADFMSQHASAD